MFRKLRWRLTLLYGLVGLALIAIIGGGTYQLLGIYFEGTADFALDRRAARELSGLDIAAPAELQASAPVGLSVVVPDEFEDGENTEDRHEEESFDGELAAVFVLPLDEEGRPSAATVGLPMAPDDDAVQAARATGLDRRTVQLADGTRVRVLTVAVQQAGATQLFQFGRTLNDQDRILGQLLIGLLVLGALGVALLGLGSWWLAGRSLRPAQDAWDRQRAFIANASHELRTPLTLIRASAEVAQRATSDDGQRELLTDILEESDHVNQLIESLLLLSRLDAHQVTLAVEVINVPELFADLERRMRRLATERGIELAIGAEVDTLTGDRTRVWQVLLILLDNALRFTPAGGAIEVSAQARDGRIEIAVADTGAGIAPEHLPHIFERFYQADPAHTANRNGAGLGLSIARAIVEAHGGRIRAASEGLGRGSRFEIALPQPSK